MKKDSALAVIALVFLLSAAQAQSPNSVPGEVNDIQAQLGNLEAQNDSIAQNWPHQFYLTKTHVTGNKALTACDAGCHMASLWEIHDPSNLRYNTELGFSTEDSGFGARL